MEANMKKTAIIIALFLGCGGGGEPQAQHNPDIMDVAQEEIMVSSDTGLEVEDLVTWDDSPLFEVDSMQTDSDTLSPMPPFVGEWLDCIGRIRFEEDGQFEYKGLDDWCTTTGYYELKENYLTLYRLSSTCPEDETDRQADFYKERMVITVTFERMVWQHPALDTGVKVWIRPGIIRPERFLLLDDGETRGQDLRMCMGMDGKLLVGFYFTLQGYASLISVSGRIERREVEQGNPSHLQIRTSCQGACMCAAIYNLVVENGMITGEYRGINCEQVIGPGTVHGRVQEWQYQ
jgi:hypothetical protein